MNEKTKKNWIDLSDYDFETAKSMLESGRYLYVVFTCQQSIEKLLKALYVKEKNDTPPYTHNLIRLTDLLSFKIEKNFKLFFEELNSYYLESRYTDEIAQLSRLLTKEKVTKIYRMTKEVLECLKKMI